MTDDDDFRWLRPGTRVSRTNTLTVLGKVERDGREFYVLRDDSGESAYFIDYEAMHDGSWSFEVDA